MHTEDIINHIVDSVGYDTESITIDNKRLLLSDLKNESRNLAFLTNNIYTNHYVNSPKLKKESTLNDAQSIANLKKNCANSDSFKCAFWKVTEIDESGYSIAKNGISIVVNKNEIETMNPFKYEIEKLDWVILKRKLEFYNDHFYFQLGENYFQADTEQNVRFYFPLEPNQVIEIKDKLSALLNSYSIPFSFKFLIEPESYQNRSDRLVLYLYQKYSDFVYKVLIESFTFKDAITDSIQPLFTKMLENGISFAESPTELTKSFGSYRSEIIARCIISGMQNEISKNEISQFILRKLEKLGFNTLEMYRNPETNYPYEF